MIIPDKRIAISGVHLFGLQLKCIDKNRKNKPRVLKLHNESSKPTQIKRAKGLAKRVQVHFENSTKDYYNPKDHVVLKSLEFTVQNKEYYSSFEEKNPNKKTKNCNQ